MVQKATLGAGLSSPTASQKSTLGHGWWWLCQITGCRDLMVNSHQGLQWTQHAASAGQGQQIAIKQAKRVVIPGQPQASSAASVPPQYLAPSFAAAAAAAAATSSGIAAVMHHYASQGAAPAAAPDGVAT
eukprot:scaffold320676_cov18-Tisochrysis_lutea.AAC.2